MGRYSCTNRLLGRASSGRSWPNTFFVLCWFRTKMNKLLLRHRDVCSSFRDRYIGSLKLENKRIKRARHISFHEGRQRERKRKRKRTTKLSPATLSLLRKYEVNNHLLLPRPSFGSSLARRAFRASGEGRLGVYGLFTFLFNFFYFFLCDPEEIWNSLYRGNVIYHTQYHCTILEKKCIATRAIIMRR